MFKLVIFCTFLLSFRAKLISEEKKPFWLEKGTHMEGVSIYFVGIAKENKSLEMSKEKALAYAKEEIQKHFDIYNLADLPIKEEMFFSETESNENISGYILVKINMRDITGLQAKYNAELEAVTQTRLNTLDKQIKKNKALIIRLKNKERIIQKQYDLLNKIGHEIDKKNVKILNVKCGMDKEQITRIFGKPDQSNGRGLRYGTYWVVLVNGISACLYPNANYDFYKSNCSNESKRHNPSFIACKGKSLIKSAPIKSY